MLFLFIGISACTHANVKPTLRNPADFESAADALPKLNQPPDTKFALVHYTVAIKKQKKFANLDRCSAVIISDTGVMLTASHCLDECRFESDGSPTRTDQDGRQVEMPATDCRISTGQESFTIEILKANSCAMGKKVGMPGVTVDRNQLAANCRDDDLSDLAIIRPVSVDSLGDFRCLPTAEKHAALNGFVFAMGYPRETFRREFARTDARDSNGSDLAVTSGHVIESVICEQTWRARNWISRKLWGDSGTQEKYIPRAFHDYISKFIQSDIDTTHGLSGGPLLNEKGEVLGVVSWTIDDLQNERHQCKGATFVQPLGNWKKDLKISCEDLTCSKRP